MHKLSSNGSMAYSYFGETEEKKIFPSSTSYSIAKFEFQTPILINGSAEVKVSGLNSLFVSSKEGIYIGVDIDVGKAQLAVDKNVGGFCVSAKKANGNAYYLTIMIATITLNNNRNLIYLRVQVIQVTF